ncbi:2'-5'-oligoadenylate synthase 2-like [Gigantopelta aegis]|uniref:2'-5'-oligoadenylate synthase 2-like n=1 Tax=Gigantopelta aegis TaxID=1735272 RepID=UPI001B88E61C|nr:2'-5'-oligoadenylate synthase 2-like [Gigantopelta aegis]
MHDKKHNTSSAVTSRAAIFPGFQTNHISTADAYRATLFGIYTDHTSAAATGRAMTDSWHVDILKGSRKGENLDDFMKRKVFPDEEYKRKSKQLVNYLTKFVQHNIPFSVKKMFVGGSQGKKIDVLDNADVDLVMYINDYDTMEEFRNNLDDVLQNLEQHIQKDLNWAENVKVIDRTHHAVQFEVKLKGYDHPINVDLLPAIDLPEKAHSAKEMFNDMKSLTPDKQKFFSVCTSEKQTQFAREAPKQLKELTRLVKYWKKTENVPGKSYFFELFIRHLWETEWGKPQIFSMEEKFKDVIRNLKTTRSMRIIWPELYDAEKYTTVPERPVMLDPMNPFQNVAPSGTDVDGIIEKATSLQ